MKNKICVTVGILCLSIGVTRGMEVHEWGTFTVLSGSNGQKLRWYQPAIDLAPLPDFVGGLGFRGKGTPAATVRMETPVLYFYPEESAHVTVDVSFESGTITEAFPHSRNSISASWSGTLMPPDDRASLELIPMVAKSQPGGHYEAARAVPNAWIFLADKVELPVTDPRQDPAPEPPVQQAEKFIFYRGAGESSPMLQSSLSENGSLTLTNFEAIPWHFNVALKIENGKATWKRLDALAQYSGEGNAPSLSTLLDAPEKSVPAVEQELAGVFESALSAEGLTRDEAKAMVETWRSTWFREPGVRVFSLVPQAWVDRVLPLNIVPTPKVTKRVFVSRFEILPPHKEADLVKLLNADTEINEAALAAFEDMELGRFSSGALQRAQDLQTNHMQTRYWMMIQAQIAERDKAAVTSASIR